MSKPQLGERPVIAPLWSVDDVARFLGVPVRTVYSWRSQGLGPTGRKIGKYLRYRPEDVMSWVDNIDNGAA